MKSLIFFSSLVCLFSALSSTSAFGFGGFSIPNPFNPLEEVERRRRELEEHARRVAEAAARAAAAAVRAAQIAEQEAARKVEEAKVAAAVAAEALKTPLKSPEIVGQAANDMVQSQLENAKTKTNQAVEATKDAVTTVENAAEAGKAAAELATHSAYATAQVQLDGAKALERFAETSVRNNLVRPAEELQKKSFEALNQLIEVHNKAAKDVAKFHEKAASDTLNETKRALENLEDARQAFNHYAENQAKSALTNAQLAERRIREGKIVDAIWQFQFDQANAENKNSAQLTQESELVRVVAQTAASAYGGPGGAAAFAAWYTYNQTGDAALSLKMGLIAGATSEAFGKADHISGIAKKAAVTGAIGGIAVAASGGDEAAIRKGFLYAGGMVLVKGAYLKATEHTLNPKGSEGEAYTKLQKKEDYMLRLGDADSPPEAAYIRDEHGNVLFDEKGYARIKLSKLDSSRPQVGLADSSSGSGLFGEKSGTMTFVSRVPGMNAMAVVHDQWAESWSMPQGALQLTIPPAVVFTYLGTEAPTQEVIQNAGTKDTEKPENE